MLKDASLIVAVWVETATMQIGLLILLKGVYKQLGTIEGWQSDSWGSTHIENV